MSERLLLVVNPRSGRCRLKEVLFDIVSVLTEGGKTVTVYPTRNKETTISYIAENAHNYDLITVCGGDGTLNEAFNGLLRSGVRIPVGYIPLGSTNDFATSLDLPSDCIEATRTILEGKPYSYDVGVMNRSYFTYIACAGAFAETSYMTNQNLKNKIGHSAYLLSSVKSLPSLKKTTMEISTPEFSVTDDYLFVSFSNSHNAGVVLNFNRHDIEFNDGLFELLLIKYPKDLIDFSTLVIDLINANFNNKYIQFFKTNECRIKAEKNIGWSLDGEDGGASDEAIMKVLPKAIDIIRKL